MLRAIGRLLHSRIRDERGMALAMAIGVMATIAIVGGSVTLYSTSNERTANRSRADQRAYSLAQSGIDSAVAQLANGSSSTIKNANFFDTLTKTASFGTGESVTWTPTRIVGGTGAIPSYKWRISSVGTVPNPAGAGSISRTVTADIRLKPTTKQQRDSDAWKYVYSWKTGDPDGCDMELPNNPSIQSSIYVAGNLCLDNNSSILGPTTPGVDPEVNLNVRGNVVLKKNVNDVGTLARPLTSLNVAGALGCSWFGGAYHRPCTAADHTRPTSTIGSPVVQPVANFTDWYVEASPGPLHPCETSSGIPPRFENELVNPSRNNSVGTQYLDTMSSYTCKTGLGEISWNATTRTLTVSGTIYIDGSLDFSSGTTLQYNGSAALYLSGTMLMHQTSLCGTAAGSACDTANWDSANDVLVFVIGGQQNWSQCTACSALLEQSSTFQGALYGEYNLGFQNNSQVQGPMVSKEELIQNSFTFNYIPNLVNVPFGLPGNTITTYTLLGSPTNYSG